MVNDLTSDWFADETRKKISDVATQNVTYYDPAFENIEDAGTAQVTVMGRDGTAVTATSTINY